MSKNKKLIPELRFPEFVKDGEWKSENLGELCDVRDGTHDSPKYVSEGYPLITSKNLLTDGTMDFTNVNYLTEYDYIQINKRSKVDIGDILFGMIGTIGNPVIVKKEGFAIKNVALIKRKGQINQNFLLHQLKSNFIGKQFDRVNAGGILKFIALGIIRDLKILVPKENEQQKIASCLSSLDEVITAHSQKLEVLKDHKKGLMQNLFPQESEKVPKYRFKEFENDGDWKEKSLENLGETISGLSGKSAENFGSGKPYVTYKQVFDKAWVDFSKCGLVQIEHNEKQNKLQKGDILFTTSSETPNEVGFASVVLESPINDTYLNSFCFAFRPNEIKKLQPEFSRYLFHSPAYRKAVGVLAQGSTRFNISKSSFLKLKISIPQPIEQQKIASCLSALDELITAQAEKIEQLKQHKKGLMQGLFPKKND